jgi:hypothetical protein
VAGDNSKKTYVLRVSTHWESDGISVSVWVEDVSRNKCFFQVRILHVLRFMSIVTCSLVSSHYCPVYQNFGMVVSLRVYGQNYRRLCISHLRVLNCILTIILPYDIVAGVGEVALLIYLHVMDYVLCLVEVYSVGLRM